MVDSHTYELHKNRFLIDTDFSLFCFWNNLNFVIEKFWDNWLIIENLETFTAFLN